MEYIKEISFCLTVLSTVVALLYFTRPDDLPEVRHEQDPDLGDYKSINARD